MESKNINNKKEYNREYKKYKYDGKQPWFIWTEPKEKTFDSFEDMIQDFLKESNRKIKNIKREFICNNELEKLAIKKSKYLKSKNKKEDYDKN